VPADAKLGGDNPAVFPTERPIVADTTLENDPAAEPAEKAPRFGLATATFVVISSMIGTGVLTTSGFTVYFVGSNQLMLLLWFVGGVIAVCGALTLCELSASMPRSGGDYVYLHEAYGPLAAFLSGWVSFLIGFGGPIALSAFGSAKYLLAPLGLDGPTAAIAQPAAASVAIIAFGVIHCLGRGPSIQAQGWATAVKIVILAALAAALIAGGWGRWSNLEDLPPLGKISLSTMASSLVYISYAYTGWNGAAYIAGDVERPQQQMPRAILLGTGLVLVVYVALNVGYALALSSSDVQELVGPAKKVDVLTEIGQIAAKRLYGAKVATPLSLAIGLTLLASVSAYVLTGPRVAFAMARAAQFPAIAGRLSANGSPVVATVLQVAWALVLLWTAAFEPILLYAGVGLAIFSMLTVSSVFVLRWRRPDLPRPFRTPGYPIVPAIYLIGTGILTAAVIRERTTVAAYSIGSILAGVPFYLGWAYFTHGKRHDSVP
jgi:basic amino acid/polyamine antiporter, APA family